MHSSMCLVKNEQDLFKYKWHQCIAISNNAIEFSICYILLCQKQLAALDQPITSTFGSVCTSGTDQYHEISCGGLAANVLQMHIQVTMNTPVPAHHYCQDTFQTVCTLLRVPLQLYAYCTFLLIFSSDSSYKHDCHSLTSYFNCLSDHALHFVYLNRQTITLRSIPWVSHCSLMWVTVIEAKQLSFSVVKPIA